MNAVKKNIEIKTTGPGYVFTLTEKEARALAIFCKANGRIQEVLQYHACGHYADIKYEDVSGITGAIWYYMNDVVDPLLRKRSKEA